jgi:hypothetical protein
VSKSAVELSEFECGQGGNKVSQLILEHQSEEIAADRANARQTILRTEHDFSRETKNFTIHGCTNYRGHVFVFSDKSPGNDNIITRFGAALRNPFTSSINLPSPHERACSEIRARAWRESRLRCLRKSLPSFASVRRRCSCSAYCLSAVRMSAARLWRREVALASSSKSFRVPSSIAMFFIDTIISAVLRRAQDSTPDVLARADRVIK